MCVAIWRAANGKALRPQPTHQAKLVMWYLMFRLPLYFAAIPEAELMQACARFNIFVETWRRQDARSACSGKCMQKCRNSRTAVNIDSMFTQQFQDWQLRTTIKTTPTKIRADEPLTRSLFSPLGVTLSVNDCTTIIDSLCAPQNVSSRRNRFARLHPRLGSDLKMISCDLSSVRLPLPYSHLIPIVL